MASLLIAASFLTYNKVKDKRAAKKEAKRKGYERRYSELEREHSQTLAQQEKHVHVQMRTQQTGSSQGTEENNASPSSSLAAAAAASAARTTTTQQQQQPPQDLFEAEDRRPRRGSSDSERAESTHSRDGPTSWVDGVLREREKEGRGTS